MFEAKYRRFITKSSARFAEPEEICSGLEALGKDDAAPPAGVPLYARGKTVFVDTSDNHTVGIGPSGCKKSRTAVFTTAFSVIASGESAVINDPKGEIYRRTAWLAKKKEAYIKVLNFRKPSLSHHWNPLIQAFNYLKAGKEDEAIQCVAEFSHAITSPALENTNDRYWQDTARMFLVSLILILLATNNREMVNVQNLIPFCFEESYPALKAVLQRMNSSHPAAAGLHAVIDLDAEKTRSCVYSSLVAMMNPFMQNRGLQEMLSGDTFDVETIAKKQTIVYVIYPDEKESMNFLVNMFLTQCYEVLVNHAADRPDDRLPVRCNFILDEFSNLTPISRFSNRIAEARSKNIRYFIFIQSYGQLKEKYGNEADSILANCNNWLCWSSKDVEFLRTVSAMCGTQYDYNGVARPLIDAFEMQHLQKRNEGAEVLVLRQGLFPYVTFLPDIDYMEEYQNAPVSPYPYYAENASVKLFDIDGWIKMLDDGVIPIPYPKKMAG